MCTVYDAWKPLRNYLNTLDLIDALGVIRAYSVHRALRVAPPMPNDIEVHSWIDKPEAFLPWELETLAREAVIVCKPNSSPRNTLKKANSMGSAVNKMKAIEEFIAEHHISQKNIMHEVSVRLAHRQFKYQTDRPSNESMVRYSKIFGHPKMVPIVKKKLGLEPKQLFTLGTSMFGNYTQYIGMFYPLENLSLTSISQADYDQFMSLYSKPLDEIKAMLISPTERHLDDQFFYGHHSLYTYPIIFTDINGRPAHVCPLPTLLYWRITSGLYYDLYREKGFDNAFGDAFEEYVGSVFTKTFEGTSIGVYPGEPNTAASPNRCDWVIDQADECLIDECKTKRLTMGAKTSLLDDKELFAQLGLLGDAVTQAYLSLKAYRDEAYQNPVYTLDPEKKAFICVTTLEKWYLMGEQLRMLHEIIKEKVVNAGMPESIIDESPYIVVSVDDAEELAYLAKTHALSELIEPYVKDRLSSGWEYATFLRNTFRDELQNYEYVFGGDLQDAYTVTVDEEQRIKSRKKKDDV
jgi:hypothetical protein